MNFNIKGKIAFLPVEVKNRGWKAQQLLAHYFLKKGYHVIIGMLWHMDNYVFEADNCIYLGKDFYKYETERYSKIKKNHHFLASLDAEGLIYDTDEIYIAQQVNIDTLQLLDCIITWGDRQKKTIQNVFHDDRKIFSLGNSRIDLLDSSISKEFYRSEIEYISRKYGNAYILINSNFNLVTRSDYDAKSTVFSVNGASETSRNRLDYYSVFLAELFPLFVNMVKNVAKNNPDRKIILRPHPAERVSVWEKILKGFDNIYIEKRFSVNPWLFNAAVVIHSGCTTGMEAVLMGKPTLTYMPSLNVKYINTFPDQISKAVHSDEEVLSCINDCFSGAYRNELSSAQEKLLNYYFSFGKNKTCSERIVEELDKQYIGNGTFSFNSSFLRRLKRIIRNKPQKDFNVEFGHVTVEEFRIDFKNIYDSLNGKYKYKILELDENEFIIMNKSYPNDITINIKESLKDELKQTGFIFRCLKKINTFIRLAKTFLNQFFGSFHNEKESRSVLQMMKGSKIDYTYVIKKNLTEILRTSYKKVPYWHNFPQLKSANEKNCFEILKTLPLLTKDIIRSGQANMWQIGCTPDNTETGSTGGTTGSPLIFLRSYAKEDTHQPALYEYMTGLSYKKELTQFGRIVSFDGARPSEENLKNNIFWRDDFNSGIYGTVDFCSFYMTDENIKYYMAKLNELQPHVIRGYSNAILSMAKFIEKYGKLSFCPKGIYVTSEYCSKESMRYISKVFGCNVYGQYGQGEACLFAWTKANDDTYYCSPYYGYVEVLDENGNHVKEGEIGEVTVTAFFKSYQQPFIRYKTGDLVKYGGTKNGIVCLSELIGRNNDYIVDSEGNKIMLSGYLDIHYFHCKDKINSYQIVQDEKGRVVFKIVKSNDWHDSDEDEIRQLLAVRNINVDFEYPQEIPLTAKGKRKNIIQNVIL